MGSGSSKQRNNPQEDNVDKAKGKGGKRNKKIAKSHSVHELLENARNELTPDELLETMQNEIEELSLNYPVGEPSATAVKVLYKTFYELDKLKTPELFVRAGKLLSVPLFLQYCMRTWEVGHSRREDDKNYFINSSNYQMVKTVLWNYTNHCPNFCEQLYHHREYLQLIMKEFTLPELGVDQLKNNKKRFLIKASLGILHNCLRHFDSNKLIVRENNGINNLIKYYDSTYLIIKSKIMIVLAYCVNDKENETLTTGSGVLAFIAKLLVNALKAENHVAKSYAYSASEIVLALDKLCTNDNNKVALVEQGILKLLMTMINESTLDEDSDESDEEVNIAAHCLWTLSFHEQNKSKFKEEEGLMEFITRVLKAPKKVKNLSRSCGGIFFNIQGISFQQVEPDQPGKQQQQQQESSHQIMISYQWGIQPQMIKLHALLKAQGYQVWIDIKNMEGSMLSAMANAVEGAKVVIIAMSEKYKNSNPSRTEAEYSYKLNKPIVPLLVEKNYKPDGWLGALVGMQLYVDVSSSPSIDSKFPEILKQVGSHIKTQQQQLVKPTTDMGAVPRGRDSTRYISWTRTEVLAWAESTTIVGLPKALFDFDGFALDLLYDTFERSPDFFYRAIKEDFQLSLLNCMRFVGALKSLDSP